MAEDSPRTEFVGGPHEPLSFAAVDVGYLRPAYLSNTCLGEHSRAVELAVLHEHREIPRELVCAGSQLPIRVVDELVVPLRLERAVNELVRHCYVRRL